MIRKKTQKRHAFTLIELIAAIFIITIILVAGLPAFSHIASGKKMAFAIGTVTGQIKEARMYAITHNVYTAVVMPWVWDEGAILAFSDRQRNSLMRGAVVYKSGGDFHFCYWIPDSDWKTLDNVIITDVALAGKEYNASKTAESRSDSHDDGLKKLWAKKVVVYNSSGNLTLAQHQTNKNYVYLEGGANFQRMRGEVITYLDTQSAGDINEIYGNMGGTQTDAQGKGKIWITSSSVTRPISLYERAVIFDPAGRLVTSPSGKHITIKLCEGGFDPDGNMVLSDADEVFLDVVPYSGQVIEKTAD